ncbi:MAG: hypothetical protein GEU82_15850 [Luteitalea sp.]|nr:hypothetical protein [Luteitalea sp.]
MLFLVLVHTLFCGVPLLLDVLVGRPSYGFFAGFYAASQDPATVLIYCAYVATVPVILYRFGRISPRRFWSIRAAQKEKARETGAKGHRLNLFLWLALAAPVVAAAASPRPEFYLSYGSVATAAAEFEQYHAFVAALCLAAIVSGVGILLKTKVLSIGTVATVMPMLIVACWLFGKRSSVALLVLGLLYAGWCRGLLGGRRFVGALCVAASVIAVGSYGYQRVIRQMSAADFDAYYTGVRIDFGRDVGIRQAIYAELGNDSDRILDYRGQTLLFYAVMLVPRTVWPNKPWPYAVYQTARALNLPASSSLGWGVTTSWLDEAIANCGWFGLLIGPLSLAVLCRIGDRTGDAFTRYVTVCIGTLLMAVQLAAFAPLALVWALLCLWHYVLSRWHLVQLYSSPSRVKLVR